MKIKPLRLVYLFSLACLGALLLLIFLRPLAASQDYSTVQREQLLHTKDGWIVQFDLLNVEESEARYRVRVAAGGRPVYEETVLVPAKGLYSYAHHLPPGLKEGEKAEVSIFREPEMAPLEKATYYLR